jgi:hypothetical protein
LKRKQNKIIKDIASNDSNIESNNI